VLLPLNKPFVAARSVVVMREVIYVEAEADGVTGWAETAPFPGISAESPDGVWSGLVSGTDSNLARVAVELACSDLDARLRLRSLWEVIGGSMRPVIASLAVGFDEDPARATADAERAGYGAIKLKVAPGADVERVVAARAAAPDLAVGVDANGSYDPGGDPDLGRLLDLEPVYIEQPYPAMALTASADLARSTPIPIVLDESIRSAADARAAITAHAAAVLTINPAVVGLRGALDVQRATADAGLRFKASGLLETGIGRAHTRAIASLRGESFSDIAPATAFFAIDATVPVLDVAAARKVTAAPGIGVSVDLELLEPYVIDEGIVDGECGASSLV